jgi:hypothetical protein
VLELTTSSGIELIGNSIPDTVTVELAGSTAVPTSIHFKQQPWVALELADTFSAATFEDDNGAIFDFDEATLATGVDPDGSFVTVTAAEVGTGTTVITRRLFVNSSGGTVLVNPTVWELSGALSKQWTTQASSTTSAGGVGAASATSPIAYTVGELAPNTSYAVRKNGQPLAVVTSDASGQVTFTDVPGTTSPVEYAVVNEQAPPP